MRVNVISDVHGRCDGALAAAGEGADALICLGDLLLFLDYADHTSGIFTELFGVDNVSRFIGLRKEKRFDQARALISRLWSELDGDPSAHIEQAVRRQYAQIFAALPTPAYLTYGNVDMPRLWPDFLETGHRVLDGEVVEIGGRRFGFVGGGLRTRYRTPYEIDDEAYAASVVAVGAVDVLCCHIPPALPDLTYDVVARRLERGSEATLDAIRDTRPSYVLFGHVHQPLAARTRIGRTECVNVGHFRSTGTPFALDV